MKKFKKPNSRTAGTRPAQNKNSRPAKGARGPQRPPIRQAPAPGQPPKGRCVVGIHAVTELLKVRPRAIEELWMREKYNDNAELNALFDSAKNLKVRVQMQNPAAMDRIIGSHQGVMAFTQDEPELDWEMLKNAETACLIALDEVEDPHNLGAVLRTAWLFGASGVLTPEHRAAHLSPAVSKVAQGAAEHIPVSRETNLPSQLEQLKKLGFWVLGLSHEAKQDLFTFEVPKKVVWVLGSESSGLRKSVSGACDDLIRIPQSAPEASYNVSVAGAVAMAETFRQHSLQK